jgi:threonine/homoserine/homoserine lactone efflux protein
VRSLLEFVLIALVVTLTPGPATANIVRVAIRDGRRAALAATAGNSIAVLAWGALSAVGVSSLIVASEIGYLTLKIAGAVVLAYLGIRSIRHARRSADANLVATPVRRSLDGWRGGLITGIANPKLAVFFIALFPQFLHRGDPVLPYSLAMAATVVAIDLIYFSVLTVVVERARVVVRPKVRAAMERISGTVMVGLGVRLALESK